VFVEQARPAVFVTVDDLHETALASCVGQTPETVRFTVGPAPAPGRMATQQRLPPTSAWIQPLQCSSLLPPARLAGPKGQ